MVNMQMPAAADGRWGRWGIPSALLLVLLACALAGAQWLNTAVSPERVTPPAQRPFSALHALLPGEVLTIPPNAMGLWKARARQGEVHVLLQRATPSGEPQVVNLCHQRMNQRHNPDVLYPIALRANLKNTGPDTARNPLIVAHRASLHLPLATVRGEASATSDRVKLHLEVRDTEAPPITWDVLFAEPEQPVTTQGEHRVFRFPLGAELWLVWQPAQADFGERTNLLPDAHRYKFGVRIRKVHLPQCTSGGLEWQLFDGDLERTETGAHLLAGLSSGGTRPIQSPAPIGTHTVPESAPQKLEDERLFEALTESGLAKPVDFKNRLSLAPSDGLHADGGDHRPLLRTLFGSANGRYVQAQVRAANQARHWLAVRVALPEGQPLNPGTSALTGFRASSANELLTLEQGLPPTWVRLFKRPQAGWSDWVRVMAPQTWLMPDPSGGLAQDRPTVHLEVPVEGHSKHPLHLQLLGKLVEVDGGELLEEQAACLGPGCSVDTIVVNLRIAPKPGVTKVRLKVGAWDQFIRMNADTSGAPLRVQARRGDWRWSAAPHEHRASNAAPASVEVRARDGQILFANGELTATAHELGVGPMVGLGPTHERSLVGMLGRLGALGQRSAVAQTTLEPEYQRVLTHIMRCVAGGGDWDPNAGRCVSTHTTPVREADSFGAVVVMDARLGDVVAATSGENLPHGITANTLLAFDRFNPTGSPLALHAWQHDGGPAHAPGSAFKLLQAMSFVVAASDSPEVMGWIYGLPVAQVDAVAKAAGKPFQMSSACYPSPCSGHQPHVTNFGLNAPEPASRYASSSRFGLREALRHSVNTWFAMTAEWVDQTVAGGHVDARPLGSMGLWRERPIRQVVGTLGFLDQHKLDGGLLPDGFSWHPDDALLASASNLDPVTDVSALRFQALGLRMQTTPLQMAMAAAAIATDRPVTPRLLLSLNGVLSTTPPKEAWPLMLHTTPIQEAMQDVVSMGTAARAFADPLLQPVRQFVHGKTGSAPLAGPATGTDCKRWPLQVPAPVSCLHNAWFVGYLRPGAIPGEARTLAFAVQISHTRGMGGSQAAPVVAAWLKTLWAAHQRTGAPPAPGSSQASTTKDS